jgi:hypothetical protein
MTPADVVILTMVGCLLAMMLVSGALLIVP